MNSSAIGIGDLRCYVPRLEMRLEPLVARRIADDADLARHLDRAVKVTGQAAIRFPSAREDTATMAAEAAADLLHANPQALDGLRHFVVGTETGLDHSKPLSAYVQGMLQRSGLAVPTGLSSFQVQHACAGGTLGLLSIASLLATGGAPKETGVVVAVDTARYRLKTTAEITQGAGAAAVLVERDPRLLELDLATVGYASHDVDDFFRPLGSVTAMVKGSYSMECYYQSLDEAFADHASRSGSSGEALLKATDFVMLHTPFRNMPELAMRRLLSSRLGLDEAASTEWLQKRGFFESVDTIAQTGNAYSASLYLVLAQALRERYAKLGKGIVGKRFLMASYGSGNVMIVLGGRVAAGAPERIESWGTARLPLPGQSASMAEYDRWTSGYGPEEIANDDGTAAGRFRLVGIREDGYREYEHLVAAESAGAKAGSASAAAK